MRLPHAIALPKSHLLRRRRRWKLGRVGGECRRPTRRMGAANLPESGIVALVLPVGKRRLLRRAGSARTSNVAFRGITPESRPGGSEPWLDEHISFWGY